MKRIFSGTLLTFIIAGSSLAQNLTQTVKGRITDQDSRMPAVGAVVIIIGSDPIIATGTDADGNFKLENIPVGRISLKVTSIGYEDRVIPNIQVTSGKETIVNMEMAESVSELQEVVVKAQSQEDKKEALNEMSLVSTRTFSVEETQRYAGAINDPARMVSAFAGVNGDAEGNNDIIVRGNSPRGILWRLEGIEIPNPNHFSEEGSTGGPINALNSAMLANSDFSTGAFAPEYGNALSGVFDMKLRTGNNENREYTFGFGILGTDITMEGPFKKGGKSSYLANYRYSSLAILDNAGIVDFGGVPKYQDASFKMHFPTPSAGTFSVFGLGGISHITEQSEHKDTLFSSADFNANMGVVGVSNLYFPDDKTFVDSKISYAQNGSGFSYADTTANLDLENIYRDDNTKTALKFSSSLNRKFNAKNRLESGLIYTILSYNLNAEQRDEETNEYVKQLDTKESTGYVQGYTSWKHRLNEDITIVGGFHYLHLALNNSYSIEPRLSAKWQVAPRHSVNAGLGIHSKMESLLFYTAKVPQGDGSLTTPNKDLKLPKAQHAVLGYDFSINSNTHMKVETYYQRLYDMPVENDRTSSYATLNASEWFEDVALVNEGKGQNYGIELTLERFLANNFYYLFTTSIYDSKYTALDGIERHTRYNGNYTSNLLIGKEFMFGKKQNKVLSLNTKLSYIGAGRYTPLDLQSSITQNSGVYFTDKPWSSKGEDIFIMNLGANYQINRTKTTHSIKLEILNTTNNQSKLYEYYDDDNQSIEYGSQLEIIPNLMYQVQF